MKIVFLTFLTLISTSCLFGQSRKDSLIVFVGEIIYVKESPEEAKKSQPDTIVRNGKKTVVDRVTITMDSKYVAKYRILQLVYGTYKADTIEFIVFDHYGQPPFSKYKTVLLYVSNYKGQLYHEKYMYSDVYKTADGRWAGRYESQDYNHENNKNTTIKPEPISFKEPFSFDLKSLDKESINRFYPEPYFRVIKGKAYPIMGNYIQELFQLKRDGFLTARGIF